MYVIVTGSAGKLGRAAVAALRNAGHKVVGLDIQGPLDAAQSLRADCTDFGEVMGALSGIDITGRVPDAVVHLAGIPMPGLATDQRSFEVNTLSTYNVFFCLRAARNFADRVGIERNHLRIAVQGAAGVRSSRRKPCRPPQLVLCSVEAAWRNDGREFLSLGAGTLHCVAPLLERLFA